MGPFDKDSPRVFESQRTSAYGAPVVCRLELQNMHHAIEAHIDAYTESMTHEMKVAVEEAIRLFDLTDVVREITHDVLARTLRDQIEQSIRESVRGAVREKVDAIVAGVVRSAFDGMKRSEFNVAAD